MKKFTNIILGLLVIVLVVASIIALKSDVLKSANILSDDDYMNYITMKDSGNINDDDNMYNVEAIDPDKIRVSFADNKFINIEYYHDDALTQLIKETAYLVPGDSIYIKYIDAKNPNGELYEFLGCDVYEISATAGRKRIRTLTKDDTAFVIPKDYLGKELQFVPLGEYKKGLIPVSIFHTDIFNNRTVAIGQWHINDQKVSLSNGALSIGVGESYIVSCKYNTDEYFFVNSYPDCFSHKNGVITFEQKNASDKDKPTQYEIELKQYLKFNFEFDEKATIYLNDKLVKENVKSYEFTTKDKISYGQKIEINTKSDSIKILGGSYNYITVEREKLSDEYHFVITITDEFQENKSDDINNGVNILENVNLKLPSNNKYGECLYKVNGDIIDDYVLKEGDELELEYTITDSNYAFSDNNFIENLFDIKTKKVKIIVQKNMDGKTLELSDYFDVVKKEG